MCLKRPHIEVCPCFFLAQRVESDVLMTVGGGWSVTTDHFIMIAQGPKAAFCVREDLLVEICDLSLVGIPLFLIWFCFSLFKLGVRIQISLLDVVGFISCV